MNTKFFSFFIFLTAVFPLCLLTAFAATSIVPNSYAWNDVIGWIDFNTGNITINSAQLTGYASSSMGYIGFNCNSTPNGNICGGPAGNWKVSNISDGYLSGWAWNDAIGWISFDSVTATSSFPYQVIINQAGDFSGYAWNDIIGWISFNCVNTGTCGTVNYKVSTLWSNIPTSGFLISSIFDTQINQGSALNSIIWKGQLNGGSVQFQIASSNSSSGPWDYKGPDGTGNTYYSGSNNVAIPLNLKYHNNQRYFRYKIFINSDSERTNSPVVEDVIINYSP
ncbi:MAG: hypothetical protein QMD86_02545 [Patescibacteria group bacterium]|nr:hypothetical protein [Patescibacteria group bacterium]